MKKISIIAALLMLVVVCRAQTPDDAMMKAWEAYMTPGDVHKMMANDNGSWKAEVTMWMSPDAPPTKSEGSCMQSMILGGRYQQSSFKGTMMGKPFEGLGLMGYDNAKKVFVSSWVDNMGTGMMQMEGTWDDATKSITLKGKTVDPMTGKDMDVREVHKIVDNKTHVMEMYMTTDGKEMKTMEIKFTKE
ncbi:DUF1579 domain-containing protein [Pedobacter sp. B4-66]|uniref:DUF1579 domain-containing protein n=1 Tax=Pedobacter sp. B4-66 TaxID=2817280 RepID=UPI001BD9CD3F|nr:DUF1579 domain-containing protein [Pedobacter sp. B4-66]